MILPKRIELEPSKLPDPGSQRPDSHQEILLSTVAFPGYSSAMSSLKLLGLTGIAASVSVLGGQLSTGSAILFSLVTPIFSRNYRD